MNTIQRFVIACACALGAVVPAVAQPNTSFPPVKDRPEVQIGSLEFNTSDDDFAPMPFRGGDQLVYTSDRSGEQRIWLISKTPNGWGIPVPAGEALTHADQVGSATLTPDGNFMVFAAYEWDVKGGTMTQSGRTDLFSAERVGGEWTNVKNLGPIINSPFWDSQPTLSSDGRTLFFASDRTGGVGGTDIYVSRRTTSGWSSPTNVGAPVNSAFDDLAPSIAPDSKTLFFSSKGHGGVGGFDVFAAKGGSEMGTGWATIENLGTPINSASDEYFFVSIPNSKNSYFCSDRAGSQDIYTAYPNPFPSDAQVTVSGHVYEQGTNQPIAATITVTDLGSGEVVANFTTDDRTGDYYVILSKGRRYSITAEAPHHIFYSDEYSVPPTTEGKNITKDINLFPTQGGTTRLLVFFDFDKAELKSESKPDLNRAIAFLKQNPSVSAEIAGHTDSVGTSDYNNKLSRSRAESVRDYLVHGGIEVARLRAIGYGEAQPIADNGTDDGKARNRRVEMRVK